MGRLYGFLGLTTAVNLAGLSSDEKREAYAADITYGTNNEYGFDYLRDNMVSERAARCQRGLQFAIIDEVDSILIDEARTPLIISGPADEANKWYAEFARIAERLRRGVDYEVDERKRTIGVLEAGIEHVEDTLGIENLYESVNTPLVGFLNNAIKAKELYRRDKEYVVKQGEVLIVDEHTGRILAGRRYSEGMHQAIEAKEGVTIKQENQTLATITLQNYFRLYGKLAGMTGTAMTEAAEFDKIYSLGVVPIPTNRPMVRADQSDLIYRTEESKFTAVVADIVTRHERGQPVLVGTTSVEKSERLSDLLRREGITHSVLNAKQHEREAHIVAEAGRRGAVTVATNMAGRGTDVMLGGNPEILAAAAAAETLTAAGHDPDEDPEGYREAYAPAYLAALATARAQVAAEHDEVVAAGGLYVLGTERHESRRIDNQLRGRSGRQGDPGESRFYLSLQDDLMRRFKGELVDRLLVSLNVPDDVPIEARMVSNAIRNAQTQVEQQNFEIRKNVLKYDEVLNRQRQVVYAERRRVMQGEDISEQIRRFLDETVRGYVRAATAEGYEEQWDLEQLWTALRGLFPVTVTAAGIAEEHGGHLDQDSLTEALTEDARRAYDERESDLGPEIMRELERQVMLTVLDRKWREHLYEMDYLQEGIGLRAMGQRDPLIEYQREGYDMFVAMFEAVQEEVVGYIFNVEVTVNAPAPTASPDEVDLDEAGAAQAALATAKGFGRPRTGALDYSAPSLDGDGDGSGGAGVSHTHVESASEGPYAGTGRNDPCPCGSGRKYKRCHGDPRSRVNA